jgi:ribosomal-protein-alanine N-acetyltransferase
MLRKEVKTKRLVLRPLKASDYAAWFYCWTGHLPPQDKWDVGPKKPRSCSRDYFKRLAYNHTQYAKNDEYYWYGVFEKKTGALVGAIDFDIFARGPHQFANFGYMIFNRYRDKGYGQESAAAGLKIGFQQLDLHRLEAAINLDNKKSIRLAHAIGMTREGVRKRYWRENGSWVDHLIYVAMPEDLM